MAADPGLLFDISTSPDSAASSSQISWQQDAPSFDPVQYFVANANGTAELWKTDATTAGTARVTALGDASLDYNVFKLGPNTFVFASSATASTTTIYRTDGTSAGTTVETFDYGSKFLGTISDQIVYLRQTDNEIVFTNGFGSSGGFGVVFAYGTVERVAQTSNRLFLRFENLSSGGYNVITLYSPYYGSGVQGGGGNADVSDRYFTDGTNVWISSSFGSLVQSSDGFQTHTQIPTTLGQLDSFQHTLGGDYAAIFDPDTNTSRIFRLSGSFSVPATTLAVLDGRATLTQIGFQLEVSVAGGADAGHWRLTSDNLGLVKDSHLSKFVNGAIHPIGNVVLGWSNIPGFGEELASFTPDPSIVINNQSVFENQAGGYTLASLFVFGSNNSYSYSLVPGAGDADNSRFSLDSFGNLIALQSSDYESNPIENIRVRATNATETLETSISIFVIDLEESIGLSTNHVVESAPVGATIGLLKPVNFLQGDRVSYSLLSIYDNSDYFAIDGDQLKLSKPLDFESINEFAIYVRATSSSGNVVDQTLFIFVDNANENNLSAITITKDNLAEGNDEGWVVGDLGVRSSAGTFTFELVDGPGGYDNSLFSINSTGLVLNEVADYESRSNYSVRIRATNGASVVEDFVTIDILPVDEFPSLYIDFLAPDGTPLSYFSIDENTPVGTVAMTLGVGDADRDTYNWSIFGGFANYFRLEGNSLIVDKPLNFEAIPDQGILDLDVVAKSNTSNIAIGRHQNGFINGTFFGNIPVRDINDAPALSNINNATINEGDVVSLPLATPLYTDEDQFDSQTVTLTMDSGSVPGWLSLDPDTNLLVASPGFGDGGNYDLRLTVVDRAGASDTKTFRLTVNSVTAIRVQGTAGNDNIVIRPLNAASTQWLATVNGATVFRGPAGPQAPFAVDGLTGNDTLTIFASGLANTFTVLSSITYVDALPVIVTNIANRVLQGQGGGDTFNINMPAVNSAARVVAAPGTTIFGGAGRDIVRALTWDNVWTISGNGSGNLNGVAFNSISSIVGGNGSDKFQIDRNGSIAGAIDGAGGYDSIVYGDRTGAVNTLITSFETHSGSTSRTGGFANIEQIDAPPRADNRLSYSLGSVPVENPVFWGINSTSSGTSSYVQLNDFVTTGFADLVGTARDDSFLVMYSPQPIQITGGGGLNGMDFSAYGQGVFVNLANQTATNVSRFSNIVGFSAPFGSGSRVTGTNLDTKWDFQFQSTFLSTGQNFFNFQNYVGGSGNDQFQFEFDGIATNIMSIDGGPGRNSLDYTASGIGIQVDLSNNVASYTNSVTNVVDVFGSQGDDTLIGNGLDNQLFGSLGNDQIFGLGGNDALFGGSGDDYLNGGTGSDWLVGGSGADELHGGLGDDILVGGYANGFEDETVPSPIGFRAARIDAIMSEWGNTNRSYLQRIQRLSSGVGTGNSVKLNATTLANDSSIDRLLGEQGDDWFWASFTDLLSDRRTSETRSVLT